VLKSLFYANRFGSLCHNHLEISSFGRFFPSSFGRFFPRSFGHFSAAATAATAVCNTCCFRLDWPETFVRTKLEKFGSAC